MTNRANSTTIKAILIKTKIQSNFFDDRQTYANNFLITLDDDNFLAPTDCKPTEKLLYSKDGLNFKPCKANAEKRKAILDELKTGAIIIYAQQTDSKAKQEGAELKPFGYNG